MKSFGHPDPLQDARRMLTASAGQFVTDDVSLGGGGSVVDLIELTDQNDDIAETEFPHGAEAGVYRVSWYLLTTEVDGTGIVSLDLAWTDEIEDRALSTYNGSSYAVMTSVRLYEISNYNLASGSLIVRMAAESGGIRYLTSHTGDYADATYSLTLVLEKLSA